MCSFKSYRPILYASKPYNMKSFPLMVLYLVLTFDLDQLSCSVWTGMDTNKSRVLKRLPPFN